jgi:small-conductance mechanosensitive channel
MSMVEGFWARLPYIAVGLVVFIIFLALASISRRIIKMAIEKAGFDSMIASLTARIGYFALAIAGFFVAAVVVFPGLSPGDLVTGLGIGSVALGFAFKDILQNLFAGFLILLYRPFQIGDQIKIDDFEGTVEEISIRATKIKTYDGERVVIPNSQLYMNAVLVRTGYKSRRSSFLVGIGYPDDIEEARSIITQIAEDHSDVLSDPSPSVDVVELADSAVNLKVQFWTNSAQSSVRKVRNDLTTSTKYALDKHGIDMPFPHLVLLKDNA